MNLWEKLPKGAFIHKMTDVKILEDENGKPVLRLKWADTQITLYISTNQAIMIGAAAKGAEQRYEEFK